MDALSVLKRLGGGKLFDDLTDALSATADEVVRTGKPGKVTLTLTVSNKFPGEPLVEVDEVIARTSPKKDPRVAIFYALDGQLHREDPRQPRMTFTTVDRTTGEVIDIPDDEPTIREAN